MRNTNILRLGLATIAVSTFMLGGCSTTGEEEMNNNTIANAPAPEEHPPYHFADHREATGKSYFVFDPKQYAWAAYDGQGNIIRTGVASGGADYCPDIKSPCHTPVGSFTVKREEGPECVSHIFPLGKGGAPMPYCAYFSGGYAVHGSDDVPNYNASHGCIRLIPSDAKWLDENVLHTGSRVIVESY